MSAGAASADTCDLNGTADWNVGASWSCGHVPTGSDTAVLGAFDVATVSANPLSNPGALSMTNPSQITFASDASITTGTMTTTGGTLAGSGRLSVTGAYTQTANTFFIQDTADLVLNGASSITGGALGLNGIGGGTPLLDIKSTFTIGNGVSTPFNHSTDGPFIHVDSNGSIIKQGSGTATSNSIIENDGTITVQAGTFVLQNGTGGTTAVGDYLAEAGASLRLEGNTHNIGAGARLGGAGTIDIHALDVVVDAAVTVDPALLNVVGVMRLNGAPALTLASVTLNGGTLDTDRPVTATSLSVTGAGTIAGIGSVTVPTGGSFTKTGSGLLTVTNAATPEASADLVLDVDATLAGGGFCIARNGDAHPDLPSLQINQDLVIGAGANANIFPCGGVTPTVHVNGPSGQLSKAGSGTTSGQAAVDVNGGTVSIANGQTLQLVNGLLQSGGLTDIAAGGVLQANTTLTGGVLRGAGQVSGSVTNTSGTVRPGASPGILTVTGDYTQGPGGTLQAEITGPAAGTQFDQLAVTGTATLDGTLAIVNGTGFAPAASDTFDVVTSGGALSGTFATLSGAAIASGTYGAQYIAGPPGKATLSLSPAPVNSGLPSIPSSATVGDTVTCSPGTWSGSPSFAFQWLRDGGTIAGATSSGYTLADGDAGKSIVCRVTATNASGSTNATSNTLVPAAVVPPPPPPPPPSPPSPPSPSAPPPTTTQASPASAQLQPIAPATIRGDSAFVSGTANDLYLACTKRDLLLIDVLPSGGRRVAVTGSADLRLAGQVAEILLGRRVVGRALIGSDGAFAARVPAPPRRSRARARYHARVTQTGDGVTSSQKLKLARRMVATTLGRSGATLVLRGTMTRPFARRPAVVEVERFLSCGRREKVKVARVVPSRTGRFTVRIPVPAGANAAIYRALTMVATRPGGPSSQRTFTLPRAVDLG